jgi:spermidine/putrescine transport system permease protein
MKRLKGRMAPYLLVLPGWLWLAIFFLIPALTMLSVSTMTGTLTFGFKQKFHFGNYSDAWDKYHVVLIRSLEYGLIATALCLVIAYPVAYWIAFYGGKYKSSLLFLLLLPFFVSFVIRTQAWNVLLEDNGPVLGLLHHLGVGHHAHILQTSYAVIGGLVYNFLPFTVLPIYVALERVDPVLLEASSDLYSTRTAAFLRVVFPLSLPGVFASVLLTFVPVSADYVNASILGGAKNTMVGSGIYTEYVTNGNFPVASALSFMLMAVLLVGVFLYARLLGTEDALEMAVA